MATFVRNLALILLTCITASGAWASSLEKMEAVVRKAPNLRAFLKDEALVNEYYAEASAYYGENFSRNSYNAILRQLEGLDHQVPALGKRLWETTDLGKSFKIPLAVPVSGLNVDPAAWNGYLANLIETNRAASEGLLAMTTEKRKAHLQETFARKLREIEAFEKDVLAKTPKAEKGRLTQEFYRTALRGDRDLAEIGAYLAYEKLVDEGALQKMLRSSSADGILYAWGEFRKAKGLDHQDLRVPDRLQRFVAEAGLPDLPVPAKLEVVNGVPASTSLFTVATKPNREGKLIPVGTSAAGDIEIQAIPRRFHGIFKGVSIGECVGGNCAHLHGLTPERWATNALKDSRVYHVNKGGSFNGFVQLVPVEIDSKTYASLEFGSRLLGTSGYVIDAKSGRPVDQPLSTAFLNRLKPEIPSGWKGIVVSNENSINNAGVLDAFRQTPPYADGYTVGSRSGAKHLDPLAKEIIGNSPRSGGHIGSYAGNMITDATVAGAGSLRALDLSSQMASREKLREAAKNPVKLFAAYRNGTSDFQLRMNEVLKETNLPVPYLRQLLSFAHQHGQPLPDAVAAQIGWAKREFAQLEPALSAYVLKFRDHPTANAITGTLIYEGWKPKYSAQDRREILAQILEHAGDDSEQYLKDKHVLRMALSPPEGRATLTEFLQKTKAERGLNWLVEAYYKKIGAEETDALSPWLRESLNSPAHREKFAVALRTEMPSDFWRETTAKLSAEIPGVPTEARLEMVGQALQNTSLPSEGTRTLVDGIGRVENSALRNQAYLAFLKQSRDPGVELLADIFPRVAKAATEADIADYHFGNRAFTYLHRTPDTPAKEELFRWLLANERSTEAYLLMRKMVGASSSRVLDPSSPHLARWLSESKRPISQTDLALIDGNLLEDLPPNASAKLRTRITDEIISLYGRGNPIIAGFAEISTAFPLPERVALAEALLKDLRRVNVSRPFPLTMLTGFRLNEEFVPEYVRLVTDTLRSKDYQYMGYASQLPLNQLRQQLAEMPAVESFVRQQVAQHKAGELMLDSLRTSLNIFQTRTTPLPADLAEAYRHYTPLMDSLLTNSLQARYATPLGDTATNRRAYAARAIKELPHEPWTTVKTILQVADHDEMLTNALLGSAEFPPNHRASLLALSANLRASPQEQARAKELAKLLRSEPKGSTIYSQAPEVPEFIRYNYGFERDIHPIRSRVSSCAQAFASLHPAAYVASGVAVAGAAAGGTYYAVDKLRARIHPCGADKTANRSLVKKGDRWYCEDGTHDTSCARSFDEGGYDDLKWEDYYVTGRPPGSSRRAPVLNYFNRVSKGLDGQHYGRCASEPEQWICTTCPGSTPYQPVRLKVEDNGFAVFTTNAQGKKELLEFRSARDAEFRATDGKLVIFRYRHEKRTVNGVTKNVEIQEERVLEDILPEYREYIRAAQEKRKALGR